MDDAIRGGGHSASPGAAAADAHDDDIARAELDALQARLDALRAELHSADRRLRVAVRRHPAVALGVAVATGYLLGRALTRL